MKRRKRLLAFFMAVAMALTAVTINYNFSDAADPVDMVTPEITVSITGVTDGDTVSAEFMADGQDSVTVPDLTVASGSVSVNDKQFAADVKYSLTITKDSTDEIYSGTVDVTMPAKDASGNALKVSPSVTIYVSAYKSIQITMDKAYSTVTASQGTVSVSGNTVTLIDENGIEKNASVTLTATDRNGDIYEGTVTVSGSTIGSSPAMDLKSYGSVSVTLDPSGNTYTNVKYSTDGSSYNELTGGNAENIVKDSTIYIQAECNGIKYSGNTAVSSSSITVNMTAAQYQLTYDTGSWTVKCGETPDTLSEINADTVFDYGTNYHIQIKSNDTYKVLDVTNVTAGSGSAVTAENGDWTYEYNGTFSFDNTVASPNVNISARSPKITGITVTDTQIIPEISKKIEYNVELEQSLSCTQTLKNSITVTGSAVSADDTLTFNSDATVGNSTVTLNTDNKKYSNGASVEVKFEFDVTDGKLALDNGLIKNLNVNFSVVCGELAYGENSDYKVNDAATIYSTDGKTIYFNGAGNAINLYGTNYNQYRYAKNNGTFSAFADIVDDTSIEVVESDTLIVLHMLNNIAGSEKYGSSGEITLIKDEGAPSLSLKDTNSNITSNFESLTSCNLSDIITIDASDPEVSAGTNGSGLKGTYISTESFSSVDDILEKASATAGYEFPECVNKTYYIYAVDNVGNIATEQITVSVDATAPNLTVPDTENLYVNIKDNSINWDITAEDLNLANMSGTEWTSGSDSILDITADSKFAVSHTNMSQTKDAETGIKKYKETLQIAQDSNWDSVNDREYTIGITAQDKHGVSNNAHKNTKEVSFTVDTVSPIINDVKISDASDITVGDSTYVNCTKNGELSFSVDEVNLHEVKIYPNYKSEENTGKEVTITPEASQTDFTYAFDYEAFNSTCMIKVTDKAGNSTEQTITYSYIKTSFSDISVSYGENEKYTNGPIEAKITGNIGVFAAPFFSYDIVMKDGEEWKTISEGRTLTESNIKLGNDTITISIPMFDDESASYVDGEYKVVGHYIDIAKEGADQAAKTIEINTNPDAATIIYDTTSPLLKAEIKENEENDSCTLTYTLTEKFPDFDKFVSTYAGGCSVSNNDDKNFTVMLQKGNGTEEVACNNLITYLRNKDYWLQDKDNKDVYTATVTIPTEAVYSFNLQATDLVGNTSDSVSNENYVFDNTAPEKVEVNVSKVNTEGHEDYSHINGESVTLNLSFYEKVGKLSGMKTPVTVTCTAEGEDGTSVYNDKKLDNLKQNGADFTGSIEINTNFKGKIQFRLNDGNGNISVSDYEVVKGVIVEKDDKHATTSGITIENLNSADARKGIYNESVQLKVDTKDSYSGIKNIEYIFNGVTISNDVIPATGNLTYNRSQSFYLPTEGNEGNNLKFEVIMTDNAGNRTVQERTYSIDTTKPELTVTYDNNSPLNEIYYNQTRTASVKIKDVNFDAEDVMFDVRRDGVSIAVAPNFVSVGDNTYVASVPFSEDGDYEFTMSCKDMAGNETKYGQTDKFTIDMTNPTMTLSYDNNTPYSDNYYGEARIATLTVTEHNFDADGIKINVSASQDGAAVSLPSISAFTSNGDVHTARISFTQDADYTISASSVDLAGNTGDDIAEQSFTVDLTAPEIEITGVEADTSYEGSVTPIVDVADGNYDTEGVTIEIVGGKNGIKEIGYSTSATEHGQSFAFDDMPRTQGNDDCYVLTATAVDKAGHETVETISYRVNRYGSDYILNDALQDAVDNYYAKASDDYAVYELNVDELENYTVSCAIDNDIQNLVEGTDYTVKHTENNDNWNQYEYGLSEAIFAKEGIYTISISSEDAVGNISDNKSKGVSMVFCIDNTAPVCIISGVEDGQEFARDVSANVVVEAYDNIMFESMSVELNGNKIASEEDMIDNKVSFRIDPESGDQTLRVVCVDAAGNERVEEIHFTFDVGIFKSHTWLWILIAVAGVIVIGGVTIFLVKKRRKAN